MESQLKRKTYKWKQRELSFEVIYMDIHRSTPYSNTDFHVHAHADLFRFYFKEIVRLVLKKREEKYYG